MSNNNLHDVYENQAKVIQIKPIELIKRTEVDSKQPTDHDKVSLQKELQSYKEEISQLKKQREQLLQDIKHEIALEKENWENEKEELIKQAHDQGYKDGFNLGKEEGLNQYNDLINDANELIHQATIDYHATIEKSEESIVTLAIHTAEKVIDQQLHENPDHFLPIVSKAIKEIKDQSKVSIYLHPNNYKLVVQQKEELVDALDGDTKLSIYINQELKENDCIIEHPFGQIDASVDTQLMQIREALHEFVMENRT